MVFYAIISATRKMSGDGDPLVPDSGMSFSEDSFFFRRPRIATDARFQLVEVSFPTLLSRAIGELGGDTTPGLGSGDRGRSGGLLLNQFDKLGILLRGPTGTAAAPTPLCRWTD